MKLYPGFYGIAVITHKKYPNHPLPLSILIEAEDKDNFYIRLCHITPLIMPKQDLVDSITFNLMGINEHIARLHNTCDAQTGVFKALVNESFEEVIDRIIMKVHYVEETDKNSSRH